jgi:ABC-2 type transport system permease protein
MTAGVKMVNAPEEALSPREARIMRAATVLRWGAMSNGALLVLLAILSWMTSTGANLLPTLKATLFFRFSGADDVALAFVMLLLMINLSAMLVVMVGLMAREIWGFVAVWLLVAGNIALAVLYGYTPAVLAAVPALLAGIITIQDPRAYRANPVMVKELRGRMRGMRAFVVLTVYLGLMSAFMAIVYLTFTTFNNNLSSAAAGAAGRLLFMGVVGVEMLLIIFIAPAFTSGAITGERERQTYDLLKTTLLASPSFVMGKLESALSYILLLLLAAIPLQSLAFLFGGVSQAEVTIAFVILTVTAITLGTIGLYFSAVAPRTLSASIQTYTVSLVGAFGFPLLMNLIVRLLDRSFGASSATVDAMLAYLRQIFTSLNPVATAIEAQTLLVERQVIGFTTVTLNNGSQVPVVSPWVSFTIIYLVISAVMLVLTVQQMRKVEA